MHPPHQVAGQGGCTHWEGRTARASPPLPPVPSALSCKLKGTLCCEGAAQVLQSCLSVKAQEPQNKAEVKGVQAPSPRPSPRRLEQRPGWGGSSCKHRALEVSSLLSPRHQPARWILGSSAHLACCWELGSRQVCSSPSCFHEPQLPGLASADGRLRSVVWSSQGQRAGVSHMPVAPQPLRAEAASALNWVCGVQTSHTSRIPSALHPLRAMCCLTCPPERPGTREAGPPSVAVVSQAPWQRVPALLHRWPVREGSQPRQVGPQCPERFPPSECPTPALQQGEGSSTCWQPLLGSVLLSGPALAAAGRVLPPWCPLYSESTVIM